MTALANDTIRTSGNPDVSNGYWLGVDLGGTKILTGCSTTI